MPLTASPITCARLYLAARASGFRRSSTRSGGTAFIGHRGCGFLSQGCQRFRVVGDGVQGIDALLGAGQEETNIRSIACVHLHVALHVRSHTERLEAHRARVWLFTCKNILGMSTTERFF